MKRLILFLLLGLTTSAFGQITITAAQFLAGFGQGDVKSYSSQDMNGVPALIAMAGASQNWDFSGRTYSEDPVVPGMAVSVFEFPGNAPFASDPDFAPTTHVIKISLGGSDFNAIWDYYRFTDQGLWLVGGVYDSMGTPKKLSTYSPPKQMYAFPLTYQTSWSSTSQVKNPNYPAEYVITEVVDAKVDGYGNLMLPTPPSTTQTLRIETKNTQTIAVNSIPIITTVAYDYEWATGTAYTATVGADGDKAPLSINYTTPGTPGGVNIAPEGEMKIRLASNPAIIGTSISFNLDAPQQVQVAVLDVLGKPVQTVLSIAGHTGENVIPISIQALPAGAYFIRLAAGDLAAMKKLTVVK